MSLDELENAIQKALLDFVAITGRQIEHVRVDTRNFANLDVEVLLKPMPKGPAGDHGQVGWMGGEGP